MSKLKVCELGELPATGGLGLLIMGKPVAIFKVGDGVRAIGDTCPHMGASLSEGELVGTKLTCPWHAWTFDLETGCSIFSDAVRVPTYPVIVEGDDVYLDWPD